jgi:hypothetical protein
VLGFSFSYSFFAKLCLDIEKINYLYCIESFSYQGIQTEYNWATKKKHEKRLSQYLFAKKKMIKERILFGFSP